MSQPVHERRFHAGRPDDGERLDSFLKPRLSWLSTARLKRAIVDGEVEVLRGTDPVPGEIGRLRPGLRLRRGQEIAVRLPAPQSEPDAGERLWQPEELPVIYEDDQMLAISKPPRLNVHPSQRHRAGSLIELLHERHGMAGGSESSLPTPCHRLDRDTSGLILFAKSAASRTALQLQFQERTLTKRYLALVQGEMVGEEGVVDLALGPVLNPRVETRVGPRSDGAGRSARTSWHVRCRLDGRTLVELSPKTGRQHQLRVHMAEIGHPIVGDKLYLGGDELFLQSLDGPLDAHQLERLGLGRQALHAWRLEFEHPVTGRTLCLEAPLWSDIEELVAEGETE